jgi:hypothetical protein
MPSILAPSKDVAFSMFEPLTSAPLRLLLERSEFLKFTFLMKYLENQGWISSSQKNRNNLE